MNANGIMWHGNAQPCGFGMLYNSCEILVLCRVPMWNCHTSSAMVFDDPIPNWHQIGITVTPNKFDFKGLKLHNSGYYQY
jgi:hypothetical protein